jgi:hypothetical protein
MKAQYQTLIAGLGLILLTNGVVISGAIGNRVGAPESLLELTERELPLLRQGNRENSGLSLQLQWRTSYTRQDDWINREKLIAMGFKLNLSDEVNVIRQYISKALPKEVYVVLEYDGEAYQAELREAGQQVAKERDLLQKDEANDSQARRLESAERNLTRLAHSASRLYAVDAGLDPAQLRQRYPDNTKYLITTGLVRLSFNAWNLAPDPYSGYIENINVTRIHVPLEHRQVLDTLPGQQYMEYRNPLPRYSVKLAYGSRYEPWVQEVKEHKF